MGTPNKTAIRLPIETWENIIDHCMCDWDSWRPYRRPREHYQTLRACCLTCHAWLPRSRLNLYTLVEFDMPRQLNRFIRTIDSSPDFADNVYGLAIASMADHIPISDGWLTQRLRNLRILRVDANWMHYRPKFWRGPVSQFPVTTLYLHQTVRNASELFRAVWAFPALRQLHLAVQLERHPTMSEYSGLTEAAQREDYCAELKLLELYPPLVSLTAFPPPLTLGSSVEEMILHWKSININGADGSGDPVAFVGYLAALQSTLKKLTLELDLCSFRVRSPSSISEVDNAYTWFPFITSYMGTSEALTTLHLRFRACLGSCSACTGDPRISRPVFLTNLSNPLMPETSGNFEALEELILELPSYGLGDGYDTQAWWEMELRRRLPGLRANISVQLVQEPYYRDEPPPSVWLPTSIDPPDDVSSLPTRSIASLAT